LNKNDFCVVSYGSFTPVPAWEYVDSYLDYKMILVSRRELCYWTGYAIIWSFVPTQDSEIMMDTLSLLWHQSTQMKQREIQVNEPLSHFFLHLLSYLLPIPVIEYISFSTTAALLFLPETDEHMEIRLMSSTKLMITVFGSTKRFKFFSLFLLQFETMMKSIYEKNFYCILFPCPDCTRFFTIQDLLITLNDETPSVMCPCERKSHSWELAPEIFFCDVRTMNDAELEKGECIGNI
jgi:hypothetical protein